MGLSFGPSTWANCMGEQELYTFDGVATGVSPLHAARSAAALHPVIPDKSQLTRSGLRFFGI